MKAPPIILFDTEDNSKELMESGQSGFDKKVTQIAAITGEGERYYNPGNVPAFVDWLRKRKEPFIYCHNEQYDLGNLFGDNLDCLDSTLVGGRMISARWGKKLFVDTYNMWPMSVKKLGPAFGLEKLETDSMATDKAYVFRDVEIIREAMLFAWQFCEHLGIKHLPPTLGGLCVKVWKAWDGENCHDSSKLSREALYGGRVELFKEHSDSGFVAYTDINSLYPSVMCREFPGVLEDWGSDLPAFGVARVTIKVPRSPLPVLPYRDDNGRILYPWGTLKGVWTIAEIRAAEAEGAKVLKVHECMGTNDSMTPYAEFVKRLYQARLDSKSEAEKLFFKLLMNNLYGRLGTSGVIGRTVWQNEKNKFLGVPFGEKVLVNYTMPLAEETNWSHAAYVTAYGRLELHKHLKLVGADRLIYCDTDSCIFDCPSPVFNLQFSQAPRPGPVTCNRLSIPFATGKELGEMKLESWESTCECWAPKMYHSGKTWKAKGVPKHLAKKFIQEGKVEFDLPFKYREAVAFFDATDRKGNPRKANSKKLSVWRRVTKERRTGYDRKKLKNNRFSPCKVNSLC